MHKWSVSFARAEQQEFRTPCPSDPPLRTPRQRARSNLDGLPNDLLRLGEREPLPEELVELALDEVRRRRTFSCHGRPPRCMRRWATPELRCAHRSRAQLRRRGGGARATPRPRASFGGVGARDAGVRSVGRPGNGTCAPTLGPQTLGATLRLRRASARPRGRGRGAQQRLSRRGGGRVEGRAPEAAEREGREREAAEGTRRPRGRCVFSGPTRNASGMHTKTPTKRVNKHVHTKAAASRWTASKGMWS